MFKNSGPQRESITFMQLLFAGEHPKQFKTHLGQLELSSCAELILPHSIKLNTNQLRGWNISSFDQSLFLQHGSRKLTRSIGAVWSALRVITSKTIHSINCNYFLCLLYVCAHTIIQQHKIVLVTATAILHDFILPLCYGCN